METLTGTGTKTGTKTGIGTETGIGIGIGTGRKSNYEYESVFNREMVVDRDWVSDCYWWEQWDEMNVEYVQSTDFTLPSYSNFLSLSLSLFFSLIFPPLWL